MLHQDMGISGQVAYLPLRLATSCSAGPVQTIWKKRSRGYLASMRD
jgi:hypothetical protein